MLAQAVSATLVLVELSGCTSGPGRVDVVSAGEPRSYFLVAAPGGSVPRPLVIALHGWLGTPEQIARMSGLSSAAARLGFAVVYPEGEWRSWAFDPTSPRGVADAAFLANVVADVSGKIPVDPARIYMVRFSSGGFMAQAFACSGLVRLAGVAVVASGLPALAVPTCTPGSGVPFILIQGTADPIVAFNGMDTRDGPILSASQTFAFWAIENRCRGFAQAMALSREPGDHPARDWTKLSGR